MNRYYEYFWCRGKTENVEVEDGTFELRPYKRKNEQYYSERQLCFIDKTTHEETVLSNNVRHFMPLGELGIACSMFYPQGDRNLVLYFRKNGQFIRERGYITDAKHLYYTFEGELHCCYDRYFDKIIISREEFEVKGYDGEIHFDDDFFWIPSRNVELVPRVYFNYEGQELSEPKQHKIAQEIMLQINMYITKEFAHQVKDIEKSHRLSDLTWSATSANIADVHMLIALEKSENNLEQVNADKVLAITDCFLANKKESLFPQYMEFFFTAYEQLSRHDEWIKSQWFGAQLLTKELDDFHMDIYRKVHRNMDLITKRLTARKDFEELLADYPKFEIAVSELLESL